MKGHGELYDITKSLFTQLNLPAKTDRHLYRALCMKKDLYGYDETIQVLKKARGAIVWMYRRAETEALKLNRIPMPGVFFLVQFLNNDKGLSFEKVYIRLFGQDTIKAIHRNQAKSSADRLESRQRYKKTLKVSPIVIGQVPKEVEKILKSVKQLTEEPQPAGPEAGMFAGISW